MKCNYQFPSVPESGIIAYPEGNIIRVFFDITPAQSKPSESEEEEDEADIPQTYDCNQVDVHGREYADIVGAIVNDRYSSDAVQAIIANYTDAQDADSDMDADKREEYLKEYSDYQQWRRHAKTIANAVLAELD